MTYDCALLLHPDTGRHDTGWGHPEHQGRMPAVVRAIEAATPVLQPRMESREAEPAPIEALARVHAQSHVRAVREFVDEAARTGLPVVVGGETVLSAASWAAALASAGCALDAVAAVAEGRARTAFALCRPPGHHAGRDTIMGFCLFNNVAVATRELQARHGVGPVLIIDWDVHHGNGTQAIFWEDPTVYYLSLHQQPWYPGTGAAGERGGGAGTGATRNVPIPAGMPRASYLRIFEDSLDVAFAECRPEFVIVSAGYDCLAGDPLGGLCLEPDDLHAMTHSVIERASVASGGRVALALEGGYAPDRLGRGIVASLRALCGLGPAD